MACVYVLKAAEIYNSVLLLAKPAADGSPHMEKAWILIHQVILHVSRYSSSVSNDILIERVHIY